MVHKLIIMTVVGLAVAFGQTTLPAGCTQAAGKITCPNGGIGVSADGTAFGVVAHTSNNEGAAVYGTNFAESGYGLYGQGAMGVYGLGQGTGVGGVGGNVGVSGNGTFVGVYGHAAGGYGLYGESDTSYGVYGKGLFGSFLADGRSGIDLASPTVAQAMADVAPLGSALEITEQFHPVTFRWTAADPREPLGRSDIGLVAEDVAKVLPQIVATDPKTGAVVSMDYSRLTALLIGAVKELDQKNAALAAANEKLQKRLAALESQIRTTPVGNGPRPE